jgi:signal transduction histidine kinase
MEELGGQVWAESEGLNKGSRFIVEMPVENKSLTEKK